MVQCFRKPLFHLHLPLFTITQVISIQRMPIRRGDAHMWRWSKGRYGSVQSDRFCRISKCIQRIFGNLLVSKDVVVCEGNLLDVGPPGRHLVYHPQQDIQRSARKKIFVKTRLMGWSRFYFYQWVQYKSWHKSTSITNLYPIRIPSSVADKLTFSSGLSQRPLQ